MEQFALCDVVMTQIKVSGGTTHSFATADEISCEPVIEEGETKNLTIKNKLIASKQVPDMVLGHDITCKDNVFTPALLADVQGGTVASSGSFTKYTAPNVGAMPNTKTFDFINRVIRINEEITDKLAKCVKGTAREYLGTSGLIKQIEAISKNISCSRSLVRSILLYCSVMFERLKRVISKNSLIRSSRRSALSSVIDRYFALSSGDICSSSLSNVR